jgi:probable rRNA maturation factor
VLSFDASTDNNSIEADIAVCVDVARRESSARNHSVERELLLYALHGLLHCCGYDDHDEAGYQAMHAEEDRILSAIGVGPTFADYGDPLDRD